MKNILSIFSKVISNLLFVLALVIMIAFLCGFRPYKVMSGSMEPVIHTGSLCVVNTRANYDDIKTGDVVLYSNSAGSRIVHRVINISDEGLETKGDANDCSDGISVTSSNFCGKELFSIPYAGFALDYLQRPPVFIILMILIIGTFALSLVDSRKKKSIKVKIVD